MPSTLPAPPSSVFALKTQRRMVTVEDPSKNAAALHPVLR